MIRACCSICDMMRRVVLIFWLAGIAIGLLLGAAWSAERSEPRLEVTVTAVSDGDTLKAGKLRLRLHGVDAPERKQTCVTATNQNYPCGQKATEWLHQIARPGERLSCAVLDIDRYRRLIVRCEKDGIDINHALVQAGWAVAYTRYSDDYLQAEYEAKANKAGLWQGRFIRPELWRKQQRRK